MKNQFESYFGGPYPLFGQLLYARLFGDKVVDEATFSSAISQLAGLADSELEPFIFSVFSKGAPEIGENDLMKVAYTAVLYALAAGSETAKELPENHFLPKSILSSVESQTLNSAQFVNWLKRCSPNLLEGLHRWTLGAVLCYRGSSQAHSDESLQGQYVLPSPHLEGDLVSKEPELSALIWAMSTLVPIALTVKSAKLVKPNQVSFPVGGVWTLLYSSRKHGTSMNRFLHHCLDYKKPSVMFVKCYHKTEHTDNLFALMVDTEWYCGPRYWGHEEFRLVQLQPVFRLLKSGPKLLSLNDSHRGFPVGLQVMSSPQTCLLQVDDTLEKCRLYDGVWLTVESIEVWGCGGLQAAEYQGKLKQWEEKAVLKSRNVRREGLKEMWLDSPDRYLLELGGIETNRPKEQQDS